MNQNDDQNNNSFAVPDPVFDEPKKDEPPKEDARPQSPMDMPDPFARGEETVPSQPQQTPAGEGEVPQPQFPDQQSEVGGQEQEQEEDKVPEKKGVPQDGQATKAFGQSVNLHEKAPGLKRVKVAIGWDAPGQVNGHDYDLDACVFVLGRSNQVRLDEDFIFYNNLKSQDGHIVHSGDDTNGKAPGDNEMISVDLENLSFDIEALVFTVSIHNADERNQSFKDVVSGFIRIINTETDEEICRFDLAHNSTEHAGLKFAEIRRNDAGSWDFTALNEPHEKSIYGIALEFGVNVAEP